MCFTGVSEHAHDIRKACAADEKPSTCTCTPPMCLEGRFLCEEARKQNNLRAADENLPFVFREESARALKKGK